MNAAIAANLNGTIYAASTIPASLTALQSWHMIVLVVPFVAALAGAVITQRTATIASAWKIARLSTVAMLVSSVGAVAVRVATAGDRANTLLRSDTVGVTMLVLVSFVARVIIRYSRAYLAGDPSMLAGPISAALRVPPERPIRPASRIGDSQERRYIGRLLATIATVAVVVIANHLVLMVLAWTATSLVLHGLLTFYKDRPVAVAVAHKKFILARCADLCMLGAVVAFSATWKTLRIDEIAARAQVATDLPFGARIGVVLVALAALLKCAQLPFHGWLIQVMEAPTPVSALLHAGVVNLGGFVLLRFAPVVDRAIEAQILLVVIGALTAVVAAIIMTTRISVKVTLAWSTCAQMGFMIMQCGLGLWEMALLHLVAHSLYKAHAFLGAGGVVRVTQRKQLTAKPVAPTLASLVGSLSVAAVATLGAGWVWSRLSQTNTGASSPTLWILGGIAATALVPLVSTAQARTPQARLVLSGSIFAVPFAYFGLHALFVHLVPHAGLQPPIGLLIFVGTAFALLFVVQVLCVVSPHARVLQRLYPWIYGGLFLDETFTRLVFSVWPPPAAAKPTSLLPTHSAPTLMLVPSSNRLSTPATFGSSQTTTASNAAGPTSSPGQSVLLTDRQAGSDAPASNAAGPTSSPGQSVLLTDRQAGSDAPAILDGSLV
jgi:NAD(P)H-quinone oxidoreductase subunit 5